MSKGAWCQHMVPLERCRHGHKRTPADVWRPWEVVCAPTGESKLTIGSVTMPSLGGSRARQVCERAGTGHHMAAVGHRKPASRRARAVTCIGNYMATLKHSMCENRHVQATTLQPKDTAGVRTRVPKLPHG